MRPGDFLTSEDGKEIPMPEKPKIDPNKPKDVIKYKDQVFEVNGDWVFYLSKLPDILPERINRACQWGMGMMYPDGGYGCHYCNHYKHNLDKLKAELESNPPTGGIEVGGTNIVIGEPIIMHTSEAGCGYEELNVRWAGTLEDRETGAIAIALREPCVVDEATIEVLVQRGLLNEFEVPGKEFDFPTLEQLSNNPEIEKKYTLSPGSKTKVFLKKIYNGLKNLIK